jgi:hypothetical protein
MKKYLLLLLIAVASLPAMSQGRKMKAFTWMLYDMWLYKTPAGDIFLSWTETNDSTITGRKYTITNGNYAKLIELETAVIHCENGKYFYSVTNTLQTSAAPLVFAISNFSKKSFTAGNDETTISYRRRGQKVLYNREDKKNKEVKAEKITFRVEEMKLIEGRL